MSDRPEEQANQQGESAEQDTLGADVLRSLQEYFNPGENDVEPVGLVGNDFRLEVVGIRKVTAKEMRLDMGQGVHNPQPYKLEVKVTPNNGDRQSFMTLAHKARSYASNDSFANLLEEHLADPDRDPDDNSLTLNLIAKKHYNPEDAKNEREGYRILGRELDIPTLCCIYPPTADSLAPRRGSQELVVTLAERGLTPVSNEAGVLGEIQLLSKLLRTMQKMHGRGFTHGDPQLKNFGTKLGDGGEEEVVLLTLDPEAHVNFAKLDIRKIKDLPHHRSIGRYYNIAIEKYGEDAWNQMSDGEKQDVLYKAAIISDMRLFINSINLDQSRLDKDGAWTFRAIKAYYLNDLLAEGLINENDAKEIEETFERKWQAMKDLRDKKK